MINKKKDTLYCGVNPQKIKDANPKLNQTNLEHLSRFITERYKIRKRRNRLLPPPWTKDPVLSEYRFTNIRREHDKQTIWVIDNIVNNPDLTYSDKIYNIMLFRCFNKSTTSELYGSVIPFSKIPNFNPEDYRHLMLQAPSPKYTYFTGAFITGGLKAGFNKYSTDKFIPMRILYFIKHVVEEDFATTLAGARTQQEAYYMIKEFKGLGRFIGYQMFVDMTYIPEFPFSENEFTVAGPGCVRGLDLIFKDYDNMTHEEAIFWLRDNSHVLNIDFTKLFDDLEPHDQCTNVMSLENCMCEISKYIRATNGGTKPRVRYNYAQR